MTFPDLGWFFVNFPLGTWTKESEFPDNCRSGWFINVFVNSIGILPCFFQSFRKQVNMVKVYLQFFVSITYFSKSKSLRKQTLWSNIRKYYKAAAESPLERWTVPKVPGFIIPYSCLDKEQNSPFILPYYIKVLMSIWQSKANNNCRKETFPWILDVK